MPRQTAATRKAAEALAREEANRKQKEFEAGLPLQILRFMALATQRGDVDYTLYAPVSGLLHVDFEFPLDPNTGVRVKETLWLNSEEWQAEVIQAEFERLAEADLERERRRKIAQSAYEKLTQEEREALGVKKPL